MITIPSHIKIAIKDLATLHGKHVVFLNAKEIPKNELLKFRDEIAKDASQSNYRFIVYYENKLNHNDCGIYLAPLITYTHLLNQFLRDDDEYFVYDPTTNLWEKKEHQRKDFPLRKGDMTLDNFRTYWAD